MAQSKADLISRQELLTLIQDHAEAIKTTDPRQHAVLAYWQTVVESLPSKAVAVEVVRCEDCKYWTQTAVLDGTHTIGCCNFDAATARLAHEYCSDGTRRATHGG